MVDIKKEIEILERQIKYFKKTATWPYEKLVNEKLGRTLTPKEIEAVKIKVVNMVMLFFRLTKAMIMRFVLLLFVAIFKMSFVSQVMITQLWKRCKTTCYMRGNVNVWG